MFTKPTSLSTKAAALAAAATLTAGMIAGAANAGQATERPDREEQKASMLKPSPEELDRIAKRANWEQRDLADHLDAEGIEYTIEREGRFLIVAPVDWKDPEVQEVMNDFYWERYPLTQQQIRRANRETRAMVDYLARHGVEVEVTRDEHGILLPDIDLEDREAMRLLRDFVEEEYGVSNAG